MQVVLEEDTGAVSIDFGDREPAWVRIYPPKLGAFRRLQRDRERFAALAQERVRALPTLPDAEEDLEGVSDEDVAESAARRTAAAMERIELVRDINLESAIEFWKLILLGDESFKALAEPAPSPDPDDWPPGLLYDYRQVSTDAGGAIQQETPLIDRIFTHWGKARSRFGATAPTAGR